MKTNIKAKYNKIITLAVCVVLLSLFRDLSVFAQQNLSLKDKLETNIVKTQIFHDQKFLISVQEPVDNKTRMIDFKWQLIDWPFIIKYPASWYVRESYLDNSSLFITQESIQEITDQYQVGMCLYYYPKYFNIQKPLAVTELGKAGYDITYLNHWDNFKKQIIEQIEQQAQSIIAIKEIELAGKPAVRIEFKLEQRQMLGFYMKSGNDLIQMAFQAPLKEFTKYETVFDLMLDSFYFKQ